MYVQNCIKLWTLIANIFGTDQAIDKQKNGVSNYDFSTFDKNKLVHFGPLTKK